MMKIDFRYLKRGVVLLGMLIFPLFGHAEEGHQLVCDEPVFNFGTVDQSALVTNVFTIRNDGDLTFPFRYFRTSCGCTRGTIDKRMIGPGETAEVTMSFSAATRKGKQNKKLWIMAMNEEAPVLALTFKGVVKTNSVPQRALQGTVQTNSVQVRMPAEN